MHEKTYPDFFTPRDEEPSLSSSEEKSSEFGWLENENEREGKNRARLCIFYIFIYLYYILLYLSLCFTMDAREYI